MNRKNILFESVRRVILFLFFIGFFFFSGCKKDNPGIFSVEANLTRKVWKMRSFSDYEANIDFPVSTTTYEFKRDGTYVIVSADKNQKLYSTWVLLDHKKYLQIGNNTFKISYLSRRLLSLSYGSLEMFYVPAE